MSDDLKYGNRNVPKMIRQIDELRKSIRAEGTPAIQAAWDAVEEHIDFAYRAIPATDARADALREAAAAVRARYMGDNNREDQEVLRCEAAILALIKEAKP